MQPKINPNRPARKVTPEQEIGELVMAQNTGIEWTRPPGYSGATWNCLAGCTAVSPGCTHCYAANMTKRLAAMGQRDYMGLIGDKHFNGVVRCLPHKLDIPLKRRKPTCYFVNSMSDLFHGDVPDEFIDCVFATMACVPQHIFQVLTKRPERMFDYVNGSICTNDITRGMWRSEVVKQAMAKLPVKASGHRWLMAHDCEEHNRRSEWWPLLNVWLGVSVENRQTKNRIDELRICKSAIRFLSLEPLLEDLGELDLTGIHWAIVGGESGPGARPCNVDHIRSIVQQCKAAGVACFVKQLGSKPLDHESAPAGGWWPNSTKRYGTPEEGFIYRLRDRKGGDMAEFPTDLQVREFPQPEV